MEQYPALPTWFLENATAFFGYFSTLLSVLGLVAAFWLQQTESRLKQQLNSTTSKREISR